MSAYTVGIFTYSKHLLMVSQLFLDFHLLAEGVEIFLIAKLYLTGRK